MVKAEGKLQIIGSVCKKLFPIVEGKLVRIRYSTANDREGGKQLPPPAFKTSKKTRL